MSLLVRRSMVGLTFVAFGACRSVDRASVPLSVSPPMPSMPLPAPSVNAPTPASDGTDGMARRAIVPTDDDLARTVVSVFGDTAALHPIAGPTPDAEPVWDIDVRSYETHARVTHFVQQLSTSAREEFRMQLSRGTRFEPMIRAKLRAGGMPEDLTYLALIESGYDPHAYSRAAAVGLWQFMSSTARDVGLRVDWWMDERRDPARATEAAIRFLRELQAQFGGSLYLAAAAYNGGPGRVARGLSQYAAQLEGMDGEDRFFALAEHDYLRAETRNYVPKLIAAALIAKLPSRFGLNVDSLPLFVYDSVRVTAGTSLAAVATAVGAAPEVVRELNPAILRGVTPPDTGIWVHVPSGSRAQITSELGSMSESERSGISTTSVTGSGMTLAALAKRSGVSTEQLGWYNPTLKVGKRGQLVAGQRVRVPMRETVALARTIPDPSIERYGGGSLASLSKGGVHVVRRGETLSGIARRYGLSLPRLKALNGMRGDRALPGQVLRVRNEMKRASAKKPASRSAVSNRAPGRRAKGKTASGKTNTGTTASGKGSRKKPPAKSARRP